MSIVGTERLAGTADPPAGPTAISNDQGRVHRRDRLGGLLSEYHRRAAWTGFCTLRASWRPDVDPTTRTALVTTGPFRLVRNPIFTATAATAAGLALLVPNLVAAAMLVAFLAALQLQVRLVEEPYLRRVHKDVWEQYAARTGRFLPWIGRHHPGTMPA
jgi:steroid 5-alpha reductase family enzyme